MDQASIDETVDYISIVRLQRAYADAVNRRAWNDFTELFVPDAPIEIDTVTRATFEVTGPAEFATFVGEATERFDFFEFVILNPHIEVWPGGDHDAASARIFMQEVRIDHVGSRTDAYGMYRDTYRRVDARWWITSRKYRSLTRTPEFEVFTTPDYAITNEP